MSDCFNLKTHPQKGQKMANKPLIAFILFLTFSTYGIAKMRNPFKKPAAIVFNTVSHKSNKKKDNIQTFLNNYVLSGILNNKIAIINHQFYKKGDKLDIFTVKKVLPNSVILTVKGKDYELIMNIDKLGENERKKTLNKEHYK